MCAVLAVQPIMWRGPAPAGSRRHLHGEMPDAAPTAGDIDRVTRLAQRVQTRKGGQEGHRKRRGIAEAQRRWLASGKELLGEGIAVLASALAGCGPAAITIQIGHGGYRVADGYAIHSVAHCDRHATRSRPRTKGASVS